MNEEDIEEINEGVVEGSSNFESNSYDGDSNTDMSDQDETDSDEYYRSDEEDLSDILSTENQGTLRYANSIHENAEYLTGCLSNALDSSVLDKSLALQAQVSGELNNKHQILIEKNKQLVQSIDSLKSMWSDFLEPKYYSNLKKSYNRLDKMKYDISNIEKRLERLKQGKRERLTVSNLLKSKSGSSSGIINKYPVEYNQAKDKVTNVDHLYD